MNMPAWLKAPVMGSEMAALRVFPIRWARPEMMKKSQLSNCTSCFSKSVKLWPSIGCAWKVKDPCSPVLMVSEKSVVEGIAGSLFLSW